MHLYAPRSLRKEAVPSRPTRERVRNGHHILVNNRVLPKIVYLKIIWLWIWPTAPKIRSIVITGPSVDLGWDLTIIDHLIIYFLTLVKTFWFRHLLLCFNICTSLICRFKPQWKFYIATQRRLGWFNAREVL